MKITDIIVESVVAEKQRTQAQRSAEKCWPGKHKKGNGWVAAGFPWGADWPRYR